MSGKAIIFSLFIILTLQSFCLSAYADKKSELIQFIQKNTYEDVIYNEEKDENFQILVRVAAPEDIKKLQDIVLSTSASTDQKALAIRALGTIRSFESIAILKQTLLKQNSSRIEYITAWAIIQIGGKDNYQFIVNNFDRIKRVINNNELVFSLLIDLNEKYKSSYELTMNSSFTKAPAKEAHKAIFLFTVYGRNLSSEQKLFELLKSKDEHVRLNSVKILGEWYASPNSVEQFKVLLKTEKKPSIRKAALKGLETISTKDARDLIKSVINNPMDDEEKQYALESLKITEDRIQSVKTEIKKGRNPDSRIFKKELSKLMDSKGNFGSYKILEQNADFKDIFLLDRLREAIMLRTSLEAMKDYEKVTTIITKIRIEQELQ